MGRAKRSVFSSCGVVEWCCGSRPLNAVEVAWLAVANRSCSTPSGTITVRDANLDGNRSRVYRLTATSRFARP